MDGFEALTEAMNRCAASVEQLANAIRQSETQCGYIKQKHNRPVYRKGAKLHEGFKRVIRTREGFRKLKSLNFLRISLHTTTQTAPTKTLKKP